MLFKIDFMSIVLIVCCYSALNTLILIDAAPRLVRTHRNEYNSLIDPELSFNFNEDEEKPTEITRRQLSFPGFTMPEIPQAMQPQELMKQTGQMMQGFQSQMQQTLDGGRHAMDRFMGRSEHPRPHLHPSQLPPPDSQMSGRSQQPLVAEKVETVECKEPDCSSSEGSSKTVEVVKETKEGGKKDVKNIKEFVKKSQEIAQDMINKLTKIPKDIDDGVKIFEDKLNSDLGLSMPARLFEGGKKVTFLDAGLRAIIAASEGKRSSTPFDKMKEELLKVLLIPSAGGELKKKKLLKKVPETFKIKFVVLDTLVQTFESLSDLVLSNEVADGNVLKLLARINLLMNKFKKNASVEADTTNL